MRADPCGLPLTVAMNWRRSNASTPGARACMAGALRDGRCTTAIRTVFARMDRRSDSSGPAMAGRTVFDALHSTIHRPALTPGKEDLLPGLADRENSKSLFAAR